MTKLIVILVALFLLLAFGCEKPAPVVVNTDGGQKTQQPTAKNAKHKADDDVGKAKAGSAADIKAKAQD